MPVMLIVLICVAVASLGAAAYVLVGEQSRRALVERTAAPARRGAYAHTDSVAAGPPRPLRARLARLVPRGWSPGAEAEQQLVYAGHDAAAAPAVYMASRVALTAILVFVAFTFAPRTHFSTFMIGVILAGGVGWLAPMWYLRRAVTARQERIRRSLPDCLDLLVVCIEAGISLDAALLRVAKDLGSAHPQLARELLIINQKTNAGMTRSDALRGLWERTGVNEVRALVSHIVQGEKWGTSTGKVLRVYAETLRRERKQAAEKKAATAPVKMLLPLGVFIFPAILLVVMGPVVVAVSKMFAKH